MQREQDEEKKKRKERQRMLDDIGVMVTMLAITLLAVLVVVIKFIIVHSEVNCEYLLRTVVTRRQRRLEALILYPGGSVKLHFPAYRANEGLQDKIHWEWLHSLSRVSLPKISMCFNSLSRIVPCPSLPGE